MNKAKLLIPTWLIALGVFLFFFAGTAYGQDTLELHEAIKKGDVELAKKLIADNKGIDARDKSDVTPLMLAAGKGQQEVVAVLLNAGADVNAKDKNGWRTLNYAAFEGHIDITKLLIEKGARVNPTKKEAFLKKLKKVITPLMCASAGGHLDIARLLMEKGADAKKQDTSKWTALMYASRYGHLKIAELLIKNGADVHSRTDYKWTTLMVADLGGDIDIVKMLIENGVDINKRNDAMDTALCIAFKNDNDDIAAFLIEKGAKQRNCGVMGFHTGEGYYAYGKSYLSKAKKCEASGDMEKALKNYLKAEKWFKRATPILMKLSEKFGKGKKLKYILYFSTSVVDPVALKRGIWTQYYDKVKEVTGDDKDLSPSEQKKIEYAEKAKSSQEYSLKCKENIERLQR